MKLLNLFTAKSKENSHVSCAERAYQGEKLYTNSVGRSMVEMLGVLAIIGVLSVGAISAYSKAMFTYKLNKHTEAFNTFLNNTIQLKSDLDRAYTGTAFTTSMLDKLNLIPDGMTYNAGYIWDIFKSRYHVIYAAGNNVRFYALLIDLARSGNKVTQQAAEICRNIIVITKENADNIYSIEMRSSNPSASNGYYDVNHYFYGNLHSNYKTSPLKTASIKTIHDACNSCDSETNCSIVIYLSNEKY